jgi:hypothetical protein
MRRYSGPNGRCKVCTSSQRTQIELLLAGGASQRAVAEKFTLTHDCICRHWRLHVDVSRKATLAMGPVPRQALAARVAEENQSVLENLRYARAGLWQLYSAALTAGDRTGGALLAGRLHENLRDVARLTGELASSPLIQNNTINLHESPAMAAALDSIIELIRAALEVNYPDALAAVLRAVRIAVDEPPELPAIEHVPAQTQSTPGENPREEIPAEPAAA